MYLHDLLLLLHYKCVLLISKDIFPSLKGLDVRILMINRMRLNSCFDMMISIHRVAEISTEFRMTTSPTSAKQSSGP